MVECGGLENRCGGNSTGGSNPFASVKDRVAIPLTKRDRRKKIYHVSLFTPFLVCVRFSKQSETVKANPSASGHRFAVNVKIDFDFNVNSSLSLP